MNTLKFNLHINEREIEAPQVWGSRWPRILSYQKSKVQVAHCGPIKKVKSKLPIKSFHLLNSMGYGAIKRGGGKSEVQVVLEKFSFKGGEEVNRLCQIWSQSCPWEVFYVEEARGSKLSKSESLRKCLNQGMSGPVRNPCHFVSQDWRGHDELQNTMGN